MSKNDISFAYSIDQVPDGATRGEVFDALMGAVVNGGALPEGYACTWYWRNSIKQDLRSGPLEDVVQQSRGGFLALMLRRLSRDAGREPPDVREATPAEIAAIERDEAGTAERRRKPGQATRARFKRRSAAAKKGWKTRRANAAARSARARKGWATRRKRQRRRQ